MNRKIYFIILTYIISWSSIIILRNIDSKIITTIIIALWFMPGPLYATLILEKFNRTNLLNYFNLKKINYKYLLYAPFIGIIFNSLYLIFIFAFGNILDFEEIGIFSINREDIINNILKISTDVNRKDINLPESPFVLILFIILFGSFSGAVVNFPFVLGEELGWRGFLLKQLNNYSLTKKSIIIGFFWGLWHFPLIMYGLNFDKSPYLGALIMTIFCIVASFTFISLFEKSNSIIAPTLLHGSINATAPGLFFLIKDGDSLYTSPVGIIGVLAILLTYFLFFKLRKVTI